jgi:hypothetical protein
MSSKLHAAMAKYGARVPNEYHADAAIILREHLTTQFAKLASHAVFGDYSQIRAVNEQRFGPAIKAMFKYYRWNLPDRQTLYDVALLAASYRVREGSVFYFAVGDDVHETGDFEGVFDGSFVVGAPRMDDAILARDFVEEFFSHIKQANK